MQSMWRRCVSYQKNRKNSLNIDVLFTVPACAGAVLFFVGRYYRIKSSGQNAQVLKYKKEKVLQAAIAQLLVTKK